MLVCTAGLHKVFAQEMHIYLVGQVVLDGLSSLLVVATNLRYQHSQQIARKPVAVNRGKCVYTPVLLQT